MVQKKSDFRRGWGKMTVIVNAVIDAILAAGGDDDDVARLETMAAPIADFVIAARPKPAAPAPEQEEELEIIEIELDPSLSLEEQIQRGGYKGGVHGAYRDGRVKLSGKSGKRTLVLLDPKGEADIPKMVKRATNLGLTRPVWDDAVATGYQKPSRQTANPLIFPTKDTVLGGGGDDCVPVLGRWGRERALLLLRARGRFHSPCRFVFVRES